MNHGADEEITSSETRAAHLIGQSHAELCLARDRVHREANADTGQLSPATVALLEWVDACSALVGRLAIAARERAALDPPRRVGRPRGKR